jgi:hypothetical protein
LSRSAIFVLVIAHGSLGTAVHSIPGNKYRKYWEKVQRRQRNMKETPSRRITVTSSLNEMSTDQLEKGWGEGGRRYSARPHPFLQQASGQIITDDVKVYLPSRIFASWKSNAKSSAYNTNSFCQILFNIRP